MSADERIKKWKKYYYAFEHINWLWSELQQEQNNLIYVNATHCKY